MKTEPAGALPALTECMRLADAFAQAASDYATQDGSSSAVTVARATLYNRLAAALPQPPGSVQGWKVGAMFFEKFESIPAALRTEAIPLVRAVASLPASSIAPAQWKVTSGPNAEIRHLAVQKGDVSGAPASKLGSLLARCKCSVQLTVNGHRDVYDTPEDRLAEFEKWECPPEIDADVRAGILRTGNILELQFYPDTPIGAYYIVHHDLDAALADALECLGIEASAMKEGVTVDALAELDGKLRRAEQEAARARIAGPDPHETPEQREHRLRWEIGFRNIVTILSGSRSEFEIPDIVEKVRALRDAATHRAAPVAWIAPYSLPIDGRKMVTLLGPPGELDWVPLYVRALPSK
jgi:hypothetical protein